MVEDRAYCSAHAAAPREASTPLAPVAWSASDLADCWTRAIGYGLDAVLLGSMGSMIAVWIIPVVTSMPMLLASFDLIAGLSFIVLLSIYCTFLVGASGQTLGHRALGLKVVRTDGSRVSYPRALLRWAGYVLCTATAFLGFALAIWDRRRQGLHDKLADTVVLGAPLPTSTKTWASLALILALGLGVAVLKWLLVF